MAGNSIIRSNLTEETIKQEYNRRMYTAEKSLVRWRTIMGDYFDPPYEWAVEYLTDLSNGGLDLTHSQGRASLERASKVMINKFRYIFDGVYQGPELAKFYREKAAKGVMYLANKTVKRIVPLDDIEGNAMASKKRSRSPEEDSKDECSPQKLARATAGDTDEQAEPWTLQLWSAKTGRVLFRLYMQYLWQRHQPETSDVDLWSLRAECKSAADNLDDWMRFVYVDYAGYNWPVYSDATLRTQFAEFIKEERSSTMYVYVEDRDADAQGDVLLRPWMWRQDSIKDESKIDEELNKAEDETLCEASVKGESD